MLGQLPPVGAGELAARAVVFGYGLGHRGIWHWHRGVLVLDLVHHFGTVGLEQGGGAFARVYGFLLQNIRCFLRCCRLLIRYRFGCACDIGELQRRRLFDLKVQSFLIPNISKY